MTVELAQSPLLRGLRIFIMSMLSVALAACGETANLSVADGTGPNPTLPEPDKSLIPTVNIAPAIGWPQGVVPVAAPGTKVTAFAKNLDHPRWLYVLPNGDVLVAETNAPPREEDRQGVKGWVMGKVMKRAGAAVPSANRITLLRDTDNDGIADQRSAFLEELNSPFGMALVGSNLYVANTDAVVRYPYQEGATRITAPGEVVVSLPGGELNHHWTKNLIASPDGKKLYVAVGSNSNVAENGIAAEEGRAAIWEVDIASGKNRIFASGLRNPVGLAWGPNQQTLWVVVNERDEIGSDLVPDYLTSVQDGGFYGWPYSYFGQHRDDRVEPQRPDLVAKAIVPDYALGPHTASLGLAWSAENQLPETFARGMFIGQHGSWNREPASGYKVIFVPFDGLPNGEDLSPDSMNSLSADTSANSAAALVSSSQSSASTASVADTTGASSVATDSIPMPTGQPIDLLTGFLSNEGEAYGRPVGVAIDQRGALLVADDVGNIIWRVTSAE